MSIRWTLKQSSAPAAEPITLAEARTYLRLNEDDTTQDDLIEDVLIPAARQYVEAATHRQMITATWRMRMTAFPCGSILLPIAPLGAVSSITYLDANGTEQTLSSSNYSTFSDAEPIEIQPAYNTEWPTIRADQPNSVTVTFTAGYGAAGTAVPADYKRAMLGYISTAYEFREDVVTGTIKVSVPEAVERFLQAQKLYFDKPWRT